MPLFARAREDVQPEPVASAPALASLDGAPQPGPDGFRGLDDHRAFLVDNTEVLRPFGIGLLDAAGATLCESITSDLDLPTFSSATTDGWAVRSSNLVGASDRMPVIMPVVDHSDTAAPRGVLPKGAAARIVAGAPIPEGADAVVPVERGLVVGEEVQFVAEVRFQQNVQPAGSRISAGDLLVAKGAELTPRVLGLIAEVGHDKVLARPRPRVVVLTADSALVEPGRPLSRREETYDACTTLLTATARGDGAHVFAVGVSSAEPAQLATTLGEQLVRADLVLLVAAATDDLVGALGRLGAVDLAVVDALPGRQAFAVLGPERTPLLVLPPGPVPAYLAYLLFGRALVNRLAGGADVPPREVVAPVATQLLPDPVRTRLLLGALSDRGVVPVPVADPGAAELAAANAVIVLPPGVAPVPAHGDVTCWPLD
jgi:molybdopterin molybdotransferase